MEKNKSLDGLRGIACLNVVFAHFLFSFFPYLGHGQYIAALNMKPVEPWQDWFGRAPFTLLYNGNFPVLIFFILSGYVLTAKYWSTDDASQLVFGAIKRYPRLVLPAAAAILFSVSLCYFGLMHAQDRPGEQFAGWVSAMYNTPIKFWTVLYSTFIGVPFLGTDEHIGLDEPLWTLSIELLASIGLLVTLRIFAPRKRLGLVVYAALCFVSKTRLFFLPFALGAALCSITGWIQRRPTIAVLAIAVGLLLGAFDYTPEFRFLNSITLPNLSPIWVDLNKDRRNFWDMIGGALFVLGILGCRPVAKLLSTRLLEYIGKISFSIYLVHWPIMLSFSIWMAKKLTGSGIGYNESAVATLAATLIVTLLASDLFYRLIDVPSTKLSGVMASSVVTRILSIRRFKAPGASVKN